MIVTNKLQLLFFMKMLYNLILVVFSAEYLSVDVVRYKPNSLCTYKLVIHI